jgi:hypothetical protein
VIPASRPDPRILAGILFVLLPLGEGSTCRGETLFDPKPQQAAPPEVHARASIAWLSSRDLDFVGETGVRLLWTSSGSWAPAGILETRTAIERTAGRATFLVRDLAFDLAAGAERRTAGGLRLTLLAGVRGIENVDRAGGADLRYIGAAAEGSGTRAGLPSEADRRGGWLAWHVSAGVAFADRGIEARGFASARLRLGRCREGPPCPRGVAFFDLLREADRWRGEWRAGALYELGAFGDGKASLFGGFAGGSHPFGLKASGLLVGMELEGARGTLPSPNPVEGFRGRAALGAGDGRQAARFDLAVRTRAWARGWRGLLDLDTNVLAGEKPGELYSLVDLGLERGSGRLVVGAYVFHRSNHRLGEPGEEVSSLNVLQGGIETDGWSEGFSEANPGKRLRWEGRLRAGPVLSSAFGQRKRWHLRAGGRVLRAAGQRLAPFAEMELEEGHVGRRLFAAGVYFPSGTDLRLEYRSDEQFYGRDRTALLVLAGQTF